MHGGDMTSRDRFEAHYDDWRGGGQNWTASNRMGESYCDPKAATAWIHWQASRAAVVITLPNTEFFGEYSEEAARTMRDSCADAIEEQGINFEVAE